MERQEVFLLPRNEMLVQCWVTLRVVDLTMCSSRKYPYSPHRRDWNFLGNGGFWKIKNYKGYEALLEFPEGWGGVRKNCFLWGGMDIFWNNTIEKSRSTTLTITRSPMFCPNTNDPLGGFAEDLTREKFMQQE